MALYGKAQALIIPCLNIYIRKSFQESKGKNKTKKPKMQVFFTSLHDMEQNRNYLKA